MAFFVVISICFGRGVEEGLGRKNIHVYLLQQNSLIVSDIHNSVLKTKLVFAGDICYNCKREKKVGGG